MMSPKFNIRDFYKSDAMKNIKSVSYVIIQRPILSLLFIQNSYLHHKLFFLTISLLYLCKNIFSFSLQKNYF